MIREITIENFKSVRKVTLPLGRINVFIGENGCGKSNLLEAIAFVGADIGGEIRHELLASRGVRPTAAEFMVPAFDEQAPGAVQVGVQGDPGTPVVHRYVHDADRTHWYSESWSKAARELNSVARVTRIRPRRVRIYRVLRAARKSVLLDEFLRSFLIFAPENTVLRTFQSEAQILPLGIKGEGLFAHLKALGESAEHRHVLSTLSEHLELIDWFGGLQIPGDLAPFERTLKIRDRYLTDGRLFDQRSANEGFLFLLFYFTLMLSPHTPRFFAIDNVESSLNPKLARELVRRLAALATSQDRQLLLTTHSPAVLDGLDLSDDEQRLFVVTRGAEGDTRVRRVAAPRPQPGEAPVRLSEAFMMGYLGGLPKNF